jgi:hypothetical protein
VEREVGSGRAGVETKVATSAARDMTVATTTSTVF